MQINPAAGMPGGAWLDLNQHGRHAVASISGQPGFSACAMATALTIIRDEHRTIAAILHGMEYLVEEIRAGKKIDPRVFHAMLYYLDTFGERMHHPKEDRYLFGIVRQRSAAARSLIAILEEEHAAGNASIRRLMQAMIRFEEGGDREFAAFEREVHNYAESYRNHMRREEEQLFPLARNLLTPYDWVMVDAAFKENRDPLAFERELNDFQVLFNRIVALAPPPIGVGPETKA
jgi:hemerythrin-like domain-containing protein